MSSRIRFLYTNSWLSAAALVASTEASALPATAAQNPDRSYVWRSSTQMGVQTLDVDLGAPASCTVMALASVKRLSGGAVELYERGSGISAGAATLVGTFPTQDAKTRVAFLFFNATSARHWQLKWTNPGAVSDYAELGFAHLGNYTEPTVNVRVPLPSSRNDPSSIALSVDGQRVATRRTKFFQAQFEITDASAADRQTLDDIYDAVGVGTPFFLVLDAAVAWQAWYGSFATAIGQQFSVSIDRYTLTFGFEEAR